MRGMSLEDLVSLLCAPVSTASSSSATGPAQAVTSRTGRPKPGALQKLTGAEQNRLPSAASLPFCYQGETRCPRPPPPLTKPPHSTVWLQGSSHHEGRTRLCHRADRQAAIAPRRLLFTSLHQQ
ncbi:hypothetical protein NDU88_003128 [Pleurodeles waltl]|uniref:Uncharacterized protein n=1 Tax=Pleurodeles waltl TaxID=8319 RepID=A0AAV7T456_PLEWA|nr:hypothetical protein NDU88_003128 [Pleurodeles waltl]